MSQFIQRTALAALILLTMTASARPDSFDGSLEHFLRSQPGRFGQVMENPANFRVQVIYTRIDRDPHNTPSFTAYHFRVNEAEYFYPASTVKLPTALLALQRLHQLPAVGVTRDTPMSVETGTARDIGSAAESAELSQESSIADAVARILLVSDNPAYNRLYEFLGPAYINQALQDIGLGGTRIVHRLEVASSEEDQRRTRAIRFHRREHTLYQQPARESTVIHRAEAPILLGKGELSGGVLVDGPKDFAGKNAYPLRAQHDLLLALLFPEAVAPEHRLNLADEDYRLVYRAMSDTPASSTRPEFADRELYPDGFVKFLMYGGDAREIPEAIRVFNKSGQAFGFLTDAAYIVDLDKGVEFILAATIYTNANGVFNDDQYEYDSIGFPFLRELGQAIYELELARERPVTPDLSRFDLRQNAP